MNPKTEKSLQKAIINFLKTKGVYVVKVIASNQAGTPDLICCYQGNFIAIEVKSPTHQKPPTHLQELMLKKIQAVGGTTFVFNNYDAAIEKLNNFFDIINKKV